MADFKRGQDPKKLMGIGKKIEEGIVITEKDLSLFKPDSDFILEGFVSDCIYVMKHISSGNTVGVCSGKKAWKVLKNYMKKAGFDKWENRWIWKSSMIWWASDDKVHPQGGVLKHQYRSRGEKDDFWTDSNHDIGFSSCNGLIVEL